MKYEIQIPIFNPQADPEKRDQPDTQFAWITIFRSNNPDTLLTEMADILLQRFPCRISGNIEDLTPGEMEYFSKALAKMNAEVEAKLKEAPKPALVVDNSN